MNVNETFFFQLNLKQLSDKKPTSYFNPINLQPALKLVEKWESKFSANDVEAIQTKQHVMRVICESKQKKSAGINYTITFPPLLLDTVLYSDVFIYPDILPMIPFKTESILNPKKPISSVEDHLIAFGLEQFIPYLSQDEHHLNKKGDVIIRHACHYLQRYMMPCYDNYRIYKHVTKMKQKYSDPNPIKHYFEHKTVLKFSHYVWPLEFYGVLPPALRPKELLPYQWKVRLYPEIEVRIDYLFSSFY